MSVIFNCPPPGPPPPDQSECGTAKSYTWASNGTGILYYYVPGMNLNLASFTFSPVRNSGSNITVELIYFVGGVEKTVETWNLGTLSQPVVRYHYFNFLSQISELDKFAKLKITTTNGTSGEILTSLDCSIQVTNALFCTGSTLNPVTNECSCDPRNNVRVYTIKKDSLNFSFPYFNTTWYLDPQLSIPAPCGDYMTTGVDRVIYSYDCGVNHNTFIRNSCGNCIQNACGGEVNLTHVTYSKNNPYIEGVLDIDLNGLVYSVKCLNLKLSTNNNNVYVPITFSYTGDADDVCFTISDPSAEVGDVGELSYSEFSPLTSPLFVVASEKTLIRFEKGQKTKTIWVIPPLGRVLKLRVAVGQKLSNVKRVVASKIISQCGTPFNSYLSGLHVYSAYDSVNNPKLTTYVYSFTPISNWNTNTVLFADRLCSQPAYPYYYSINDIVYKVGTPFLRELGYQRDLTVSRKLTGKTKLSYRIRQGNWMKTNGDGTKECLACVIPYMGMGFITKIMTKQSLIKPSSYLYFMGLSLPYQGKTYSNSNTFTIFDGEDHKPVTGFQHASYRLDDAWRQGFSVFLLRFNIAVQYAFRSVSNTTGTNGGGWGIILGIGITSALMFFWGLASDITSGNGTSGNGSLTCPKDPNGTGPCNSFLKKISEKLGVSIGGLIKIVVAIILAILAIFVRFSKVFKEPCKIFYIRYNQGPYMNVGDVVFVLSDKTRRMEQGWLCDGSYFYTIGPGSQVTIKELSYQNNEYSIKPDEPRLVVNIPQLMFLPYVSGRPDTYETV